MLTIQTWALVDMLRSLTSPSTVSSLVAHWTFNEGTGTTTADVSGHDHAGTFAMTAPSWDDGKIGGGLVFATTAIINATDTGLPAGNSPISVAAWITTEDESSDRYFLVYGSGAGHDFLFGVDGSGDGNLVSGNGADTYLAGIAAVNDGEWHHVVVTHNGTTMKFYVDGTLDNADTVATTTTLGALTIGTVAYGDRNWNGALDDVRIYNTELTSEQVTALYNAGAGTET